MGQRMDDIPIEYGDDCLLGWGEGETPKCVYARFSNLVKCPEDPPSTPIIPPNDRVFKLTQNPVVPCSWRYHIAPWDIYFIILSAPTRMFLRIEDDPDYLNYFISTFTGDVEEGHVFDNENLECVGAIGSTGGIGVVTWTPQATDLLAAINLLKGYDLFMELRPLINGRLVYKFCRLEDATNIKILFEP